MFETIKETIDKVVVTIKEFIAMLQEFIAGFKTNIEPSAPTEE